MDESLKNIRQKIVNFKKYCCTEQMFIQVDTNNDDRLSGVVRYYIGCISLDLWEISFHTIYGAIYMRCSDIKVKNQFFRGV